MKKNFLQVVAYIPINDMMNDEMEKDRNKNLQKRKNCYRWWLAFFYEINN